VKAAAQYFRKGTKNSYTVLAEITVFGVIK